MPRKRASGNWERQGMIPTSWAELYGQAYKNYGTTPTPPEGGEVIEGTPPPQNLNLMLIKSDDAPIFLRKGKPRGGRKPTNNTEENNNTEDESHELDEIDSVGGITQFIHKKGDYRFRDLIISLHKINNQNTVFRYAAHTRSYTPLNLYGINGSNFLQNHLLDINKEHIIDEGYKKSISKDKH